MKRPIILLFIVMLFTGYKSVAGAEPGAKEALDFDAIRKFSQVYQTILDKYLDPVSEEALVDHAIAGMYEAAGLEPPPQLHPSSSRASAGDVKLQRLGRLSAAYRDVLERSNRVSGAELWESAIARMVGSLDPLSSYLDADAFSALKRPAGSVAAIGVGIKKRQESFIIDYVIPATPAESAGLHPGDEIVEIDAVPLAGKSTLDAIRMLRGKVGSEVALGLREHDRIGVRRMTRERITAAKPPFECRLREPNELYLRPYGLQTALNSELGKLIKALAVSPAGEPDKVTLDLRGNSGGVLGAAVGVADLFLKAGTIASLQTRDAKEDMTFKARPGEGFESLRQVTVLVDKNTASGAELIAAALQDYQRARVIGEHTGGYGTVQTIFPMKNGSAIKLTTSRMVRPSGKPLTEGVEPDVGVAHGAIEDYASGDIVADCPGS